MTREELITLRREASHWIRKLQALHGFAERLAEIPSLPDAVAQHEWSAVIGYLDGAEDGHVIWTRIALSEARADYPAEALAGFGRRGRGRSAKVLVPRRDPGPANNDHATLEAISRYREGIETFIEGFLLPPQKPGGEGAAAWDEAAQAWASALHLAIRDQRALRLPVLPAWPSVLAPARLQLDVQQGDLITDDIIAILKEFVTAVDRPELVAQMSHTKRVRAWEVWLSAMQKRLNGVQTNASERSGVRNARRYLQAVATGMLPPDKTR